MSTASVADSPLLASSARGRIALAILAPLGPLCMAGWAFTTRLTPTDEPAVSIVAVASDPKATEVSLLLLALASIFGTVGALVVGAAVRGGSPRFGVIATAITFVGFSVVAYPGPVPAVAASAAADLSEAQRAVIVAVIDGQLQSIVLQSILFPLLPAGLLLLGVAALIAARRRRFPLWVAVVLVSVAPLMVLGGYLHSAAMGVALLVAAVGFAAAGRAFVRAEPTPA